LERGHVDNHGEVAFCVETLEEALAKHGKPEIFNIDQGSQFTGAAFTGLLIKNGIAISMDGKGAWRDNVFVERLWRSMKYEEVYLRAYDSVPRPAHRLAAISTSTMGADLTRGMYGLKAITSTVAPQAGTAGHRNSSRLPKDFRKEFHSRILLGSSQQAKNGK
jgi:transposase InsO family protein